ncbi:hypothetical protein DCC39_08365 [Pueribacillus theae]|uniref:DUF4179 domain-containing protein n=1 Tax=Pueribacillus theae TaxID=2171751 RepID=A0A2U1K3Z9_9BACI|nr:DUF4179 domain-containing protein [Pueribacillus theae]PWA11985.1 hypothetical protein DCC39_08365 [Pueribacillus theae]
MNCPTTDKLSQYIDELLNEEESTQIKDHLNGCDACTRVANAFIEEERFIKETLQTPPLPDDFTSLVLEKVEPYGQNHTPRKKTIWKRSVLIAAGAALAIGFGATLNPSFAKWVGGMFSTEQVDEGLRMASEAGLVKQVDLEAEDRGITFRVEDMVADSSRVALSYQILNKNGKPQDTYLDLPESKNEIFAVDQEGKRLDRLSVGWQEDSDYGLLEFSLREFEALEKMTVKFNLVELNGVKGKWELEVPVDLKEAFKYTTKLPLQGKSTEQHGVAIDMKEVRFAPSSNELMYETAFTKEEQAKVEKDIQKLGEEYGKEIVHSFTNYGTAIEYHLENEAKKAVYYHHHNTFFTEHPSDVGLLQRNGEESNQMGHIAWNESFIPQKEDKKLTFVLDGVCKTVPSDFSIKIKPKELKKNPVSFEYEGNFITIKSAKKQNEFSLRKSLIPVDRETTFKIKMEGGKEMPASDLGDWVIVDDEGKAYETLQSESILNEKDKNGRYKTTLELTSYDLDEIPEELTLHLLSVTRYYEVKDKWKVPLY